MTDTANPKGRPRSRGEDGLQLAIVEALRDGEYTRKQLCDKFRVSRTTLGRYLEQLLADHAIEGVTAAPSGRGRPVEVFRINHSVVYAIGLDVSKTRAIGMAVNRAGVSLASAEITASPGSGAPEDLLYRLCVELSADLVRNNAVTDWMSFIGLGLPKPMAPGQMTVTGMPMEMAIKFESMISTFWDAPLIADNSVRMAALGEARSGAGRGGGNQLYLRISRGILACSLIDDNVDVGAHGFAGEIGHVRAAGADRPCHCGKTGCLETIADMDAIVRGCGAEDLDGVIAVLTDPDAAQDTAGHYRSVVERSATATADAVAAAVVLLDPDKVILGGDIPIRVPGWTDTFTGQLKKLVVPGLHDDVEVAVAALGDEASVTGAIAAAERLVSGHRSTLSTWRDHHRGT
ncbi:ROK family protein [Corynebacterium mendelii]|uniref:ROK family protein n=1 Tax=Corynebacterium mendelii TaxID=2765362 RepID=A0A939IX16_9CORY|nr:ROK family protein [Corynebacterium mendelii]MBN9644015.1 ROK family protein [Corynebacterium mendelii]